jgi:hypothetical protein
MGTIGVVFYLAGRWGVIIVLCSLASSAWAADTKDWLDEMPSVPAVVQAVRGDPCKAQFDGDEDLLAANIAGTLMLLTWVMYFQVLEDGGASPPRHPTAQWVMDNFVAGLKKMSKPRLAKLESIQESYLQAELVIGRGTGKRSGMLTTIHNCNTDDSFSMRVGNKTLGCYPYKFHNLLGNIYPSMNHRRQILPKLFPKDRAQHYVDLVTRYVMAAPRPDEPATTLSMPPGSGYQMPGPAYCSPYGGDSNGNGICDDWEKPINSSGTSASAAASGCSIVEAPSAATRVTLGRVTKIDPSTVRVEFTRADKSATGPILFKLYRFNSATQKATEIAITTLLIRPAPIGGGTEFALLTASPADLESDPNMPWLGSVASANGIDSNKSGCKQPVPVPPVDQFLADPYGYFGPYGTADEAAMAAEPTARAMTERSSSIPGEQREVGIYIVVPVPSSGGVYYVTAFVQGTKGAVLATVTKEDYDLSLKNSNDVACQPFNGDTVRIAGTAHTHPPSLLAAILPGLFNDNEFSDRWLLDDDMEQAYILRKMENSTFERIYLFRTDRCIDSFDGRKGNPVIRVGCNK